VEDLIDTTGDSVLLMNRATGRGRDSGATVELAFFSVATLKDGKLIKLVNYGEHAEARKAVGLRE
jgi:ketosteroid isomerase-like protein